MWFFFIRLLVAKMPNRQNDRKFIRKYDRRDFYEGEGRLQIGGRTKGGSAWRNPVYTYICIRYGCIYGLDSPGLFILAWVRIKKNRISVLISATRKVSYSRHISPGVRVNSAINHRAADQLLNALFIRTKTSLPLAFVHIYLSTVLSGNFM